MHDKDWDALLQTIDPAHAAAGNQHALDVTVGSHVDVSRFVDVIFGADPHQDVGIAILDSFPAVLISASENLREGRKIDAVVGNHIDDSVNVLLHKLLADVRAPQTSSPDDGNDDVAALDAQERAVLRKVLDDIANLSAKERRGVLESLARQRAKSTAASLVRRMRNETGTKLQHLEDGYAVRMATVSDIENSKNPEGPSLSTLELLAHAMGKRLKVSFEDL